MRDLCLKSKRIKQQKLENNTKERVRNIRITINDEIKAVQFWCGKSDSEDEGLFEKVNAIYNKIAPSKKYKKVIYRSGDGDLVSLTAELLRINLNAPAAS